jgi:hypothetical protein
MGGVMCVESLPGGVFLAIGQKSATGGFYHGGDRMKAFPASDDRRNERIGFGTQAR